MSGAIVIVWSFPTNSDREARAFDTATKLGEASSYKQLVTMQNQSRGFLGYIHPVTKKWLTYIQAVALISEEP